MYSIVTYKIEDGGKAYAVGGLTLPQAAKIRRRGGKEGWFVAIYREWQGGSDIRQDKPRPIPSPKYQLRGFLASILRDDLFALVKAARKVADEKNHNFANITLRAQTAGHEPLGIVACDNETTFYGERWAAIGQSFECSIPVRTLYDVVNRASPEAIDLSFENGALIIECGSLRSEVQTSPYNKPRRVYKAGGWSVVKLADLINAVKKAKKVGGKEHDRYEMAQLTARDGVISLIATGPKEETYSELETTVYGGNMTANMPVDGLYKILGTNVAALPCANYKLGKFEHRSDAVEFTAVDGRVAFRMVGTEFVATLPDKTTPYLTDLYERRQKRESAPEWSAEARTKDLYQAVMCAAAFYPGNRQGRITFEQNGGLIVSSKSVEFGDCQTVVDALQMSHNGKTSFMARADQLLRALPHGSKAELATNSTINVADGIVTIYQEGNRDSAVAFTVLTDKSR